MTEMSQSEDSERRLRDWWLRLYQLRREVEDKTDLFAWLIRAAEEETHRALDRKGLELRPYA